MSNNSHETRESTDKTKVTVILGPQSKTETKRKRLSAKYALNKINPKISLKQNQRKKFNQNIMKDGTTLTKKKLKQRLYDKSLEPQISTDLVTTLKKNNIPQNLIPKSVISNFKVFLYKDSHLINTSAEPRRKNINFWRLNCQYCSPTDQNEDLTVENFVGEQIHGENKPDLKYLNKDRFYVDRKRSSAGLDETFNCKNQNHKCTQKNEVSNDSITSEQKQNIRFKISQDSEEGCKKNMIIDYEISKAEEIKISKSSSNIRIEIQDKKNYENKRTERHERENYSVPTCIKCLEEKNNSSYNYNNRKDEKFDCKNYPVLNYNKCSQEKTNSSCLKAIKKNCFDTIQNLYKYYVDNIQSKPFSKKRFSNNLQIYFMQNNKDSQTPSSEQNTNVNNNPPVTSSNTVSRYQQTSDLDIEISSENPQNISKYKNKKKRDSESSSTIVSRKYREPLIDRIKPLEDPYEQSFEGESKASHKKPAKKRERTSQTESIQCDSSIIDTRKNHHETLLDRIKPLEDPYRPSLEEPKPCSTDHINQPKKEVKISQPETKEIKNNNQQSLNIESQKRRILLIDQIKPMEDSFGHYNQTEVQPNQNTSSDNKTLKKTKKNSYIEIGPKQRLIDRIKPLESDSDLELEQNKCKCTNKGPQ